MTNNRLLHRLQSLHEQLTGINSDLRTTDQVDEKTLDALGQLVADVSGLVDRVNDANENAPAPAEHQDISDKIMSFEAQHPRVSQFLNELTDLLAMMGI